LLTTKKEHPRVPRQESVFAIGGGQVFLQAAGLSVVAMNKGVLVLLAAGGPPGFAIGAATATAATANPSPGSCGDDAPALLPGTPPVSKLCTPISISTMFDGQVVSATRFYSSISSLY
jgi:hypothetical protein